MRLFNSKHLNFAPIYFLPAIIFSLAFLGCVNQENKTSDEQGAAAIDVYTTLMEFNTNDTIASGWQTFRYHNNSKEVHFFVLEKLPEGKTVENTRDEVVPVFQEAMNKINAGHPEEGYAAFQKLPEWFIQVKFVGGTGMISPARVAETTVKLDPGYYVLECYVKMENGMFHSAMGMLKGIVVTGVDSGNEEPVADLEISIDTTHGITLPAEISAGDHIVAVHFKDQKAYSNFVGHDVHVVRQDEGYKADDLGRWMNWADPGGLINPAPEGMTFLGGVNDMPGGSTGYFRINLESGKSYSVVAEIPDPASVNMLKTFQVP